MSERHQCSRPKRQMGPIRVQIICNAGCDTATDPSCSSEVGALSSFEESKENLRKASNQETRKDKRAKEVRLKLEASKRAKEVEMRLQQLNQNRELDRQLKVKQLQLDAASTMLQDITKKIGKASEMLHEYNKQVKAKKVLVQYYNKPSNDNSTDIKMPPIVQKPSGVAFVGRFFARPKPTPLPKTFLNASRAGSDKILM